MRARVRVRVCARRDWQDGGNWCDVRKHFMSDYVPRYSARREQALAGREADANLTLKWPAMDISQQVRRLHATSGRWPPHSGMPISARLPVSHSGPAHSHGS